MALFLALDIGTSSARTALFDERGDRLVHTTGQEAYPLIVEPAGAAELDPHVLKEAVLRCLRHTLAQYRADVSLHGQQIIAAGMSCFWHGLLGTDERGEPLTKVITWADARPSGAAAALRAELSERTVHARTGCMLRASFWPAKLTWLQREQPKVFRRVKRWMSVAEWLQMEWCDGANCALAMATGTGLFNPTRLSWDASLLKRCGIEKDQLLPLSDAPARTGAALTKLHPELADAAWYPGIGDGAASNLGSGATKPGLAAINVGTSAAVRIMRQEERARAPFGLFCYRVDERRYLVGGAISNAGNLRAWCLRELHLEGDPALLEAQLARQAAPRHGLLVLPFWTVERAPTWNEDQAGLISGITQTTTAVDLFQAITEATYHRIALIAELLGEKAPKFLVSGGIQHSRASMQRLANVLGQPIHANPEPEASLRGAAIFALEKLGRRIPALGFGQAIRPEREVSALYAAERRKQVAMEELLAGQSKVRAPVKRPLARTAFP